MEPKIAEHDAELQACYGVMRQLRPHLREDEFVQRIREQQQAGYRLAYIEEGGRPVAVAGFRVGLNLAWGRFLYVDDLVTDEAHRSQGYGAAMLRWLFAQAKALGCQQVHLDSGVQRKDAHRFYQREGMRLASYHFSVVIEN